MLFMLACFTCLLHAQPKARRQAEQEAKQQSNRDRMTMRAQLSFPTQEMNDRTAWSRVVYRELDLNNEANAGLYYPVEPLGTQMNLFTYIFKLIMAGPRHGGIAAYAYDVNTGNERFHESLRVNPLKFLDDYHIYYERTDRGVHINDSDIPSSEVKAYFIKEKTYYDQGTSTFHTRVEALCPVLLRQDDFGDGTTKYPLFWVKYDDLAPFLSKQIIMTSDLNNSASMSIDDFFTMNVYRGKIYKTQNLLGKTLAQMAGGDTAKVASEQHRIAQEVAQFEQNMWGTDSVADSLGTQKSVTKKSVKSRRVAQPRTRRASVVKTPSRHRESGGSPASSARVTVRRARH